MQYPGGKNGAGIYHKIICQIPPHQTYIEPFLGSGAIMRHKRPAAWSIGIDMDSAAIAALVDAPVPNMELIHGDALAFLAGYDWRGDEFVYCDPPYLMETRSRQWDIYNFEFGDKQQHIQLLDILSAIPAMVAISGYWSSLYTTMLQGWRTIQFQAMTRGGRLATEVLWMNYDEPAALHDYRYLGDGFRQRERIQKKIRRWKHRLRDMPRMERLAMMAALEAIDSAADDADGYGPRTSLEPAMGAPVAALEFASTEMTC